MMIIKIRGFYMLIQRQIYLSFVLSSLLLAQTNGQNEAKEQVGGGQFKPFKFTKGLGLKLKQCILQA